MRCPNGHDTEYIDFDGLNSFVCRTCELYFDTDRQFQFERWEAFIHTECVACGGRRILAPRWIDSHKCRKINKDTCGETGIERTPTYLERLKAGFNMLNDDYHP